MYDYTNKHISFSSGAMTKVGGRSGICPFGVGDERAGNVPRGHVYLERISTSLQWSHDITL